MTTMQPTTTIQAVVTEVRVSTQHDHRHTNTLYAKITLKKMRAYLRKTPDHTLTILTNTIHILFQMTEATTTTRSSER